MKWEEERYVRLFTRDSVTWVGWPWQSRALFCLLLRKVDRAGIMELGEHGMEGVAVMAGMPLDVVQEAIKPLLASRSVVVNGEALIFPKFIEAQESISSPASRQRDSRDRRRDLISRGLHPGLKTCVVYFVQGEDGGPIKIGQAEDLAHRLMQMGTSRPDRLVALASAPGSVDDERRIHSHFAAIREKGEWFSPHSALLDLIRDVSASGSLPCDLSQYVTRHTSADVTPRDESLRTVPIRAVPDRTVPSHAVPGVVGGTNTDAPAPPAKPPTDPPVDLIAKKTRVRKPAQPVIDFVPAAGTLARRVHDAIITDPILGAITGNPGDFATRVTADGYAPGVDVLAEVLRAGETIARGARGYSDGRAYIANWLRRSAGDVARSPKPSPLSVSIVRPNKVAAAPVSDSFAPDDGPDPFVVAAQERAEQNRRDVAAAKKTGTQ